jgi:DNA-binding MarR family transcriptional regulator
MPPAKQIMIIKYQAAMRTGAPVGPDVLRGDQFLEVEIQAAPAGEDTGSPAERDLLAAQIIRLATLVRRAASQRFRRMFDLSTLEWLVVVHLASDAPLSLTALARSATIDLQRTSLAVSRLVKRDLVSRIKNPQNAREAQIALTPRGRAVFNAIIENWLNKELAAGLSDGEIAAAEELMARLVLKAEQILERDTRGYR